MKSSSRGPLRGARYGKNIVFESDWPEPSFAEMQKRAVAMYPEIVKEIDALVAAIANYLIAGAGERAGLGHVHPHMLRHSCGYVLADRGTDFRVLQDFLGHRDPSMTVRYRQAEAHPQETGHQRKEGLFPSRPKFAS